MAIRICLHSPVHQRIKVALRVLSAPFSCIYVSFACYQQLSSTMRFRFYNESVHSKHSSTIILVLSNSLLSLELGESRRPFVDPAELPRPR